MDPKEYSTSNLTDVALKITKHLLMNEGKGKNIVYSPLSIQVVLFLITAGSKGLTKDQLLSFLMSESSDQLNSLAAHLVTLVLADGSARGGPCLNFANALWVEESLSIKPSFKEVVDTVYKAAIKQVSIKTDPDKARVEVNSWVENETNGLITEVLLPGTVKRDTKLIIANALYFKGVWNDQFDASMTFKHNFYLPNGTKVRAPFMCRSYEDQYVRAFDSFKVAKLEYEPGKDKERQFSMYFLLPNERDGLPALVDRVCSEPGFLDRYLPKTRVKVGAFKIPRFKFTSGFKASKILEDLGLVLPFNGNGDLSEMVESPLRKANIIHKSFIEVDEEGTKAAAVSVFAELRCCGESVKPIKRIHFVADHPFLFLIREEMTGTVQFIGHVLNPLEE
ncbi:serpin-ZX-like isoform X2 [Malus sylvestris]|uniref:serpin-ZX-like isoform X2 n=1 Tax=Malus sylvestris TaxID=3752 RepID=UPI0021AC0C51|nr:serpin-ZX-like isoform X2 [Malus sylvestris]